MKGSAIAATLGNNIVTRDAAILDYVKAGNFLIYWTPITVTAGPYTATFMVSTDSLRLGEPGDSFRPGVMASTQQLIADELGATLLTPKLQDEVYKQSTLKLTPTTLVSTSADTMKMSTLEYMLKESNGVDAKIIAKLGSLAGFAPMLMGAYFISNEGKHWVNSTYVSNQGPVHAYGQAPQPGTFASENYGWFVPANTPGAGHSVSLPGTWVIQPPGNAHNYTHADYSQVVRLVRRTVNVCKGGSCFDIDIYKLAQDPSMAPLVNHQNVAINMRYPRVPWGPSSSAVALWGAPGSSEGGSSAAAAMVGGWGNWGAADKVSGPVVVNNAPPALLPPDNTVVGAILAGAPIPPVTGVPYQGETMSKLAIVGVGAVAGWAAMEIYESLRW